MESNTIGPQRKAACASAPVWTSFALFFLLGVTAPVADAGSSSDETPPRPIVTLIREFEREHGEALAEDLMDRLQQYWNLYRSSTLKRAESILLAEQIPPRERMVELDVYLRSREGEWTFGSVMPYAVNKALDYARDQAVIAAVTLYAPYLGIPMKMILDANTAFSFLPGFSVGYGDDVIEYLEKQHKTDRYAEVHRFMLELRTLSETEIRERIAENQQQIANNNRAMMNIPDELRQTAMAELPSRLERLVPGIDRHMLWLYASGQYLPPGTRAQIEHSLRRVPQWDRWIRDTNRQFVQAWHKTMRIMNEQVLLNQLNEVARLRLAADSVCVGRTFEAESPAEEHRRVAFGFVLMTPDEVLDQVAAAKGSPLDEDEAEEMLQVAHRNSLSSEAQYEAIRAALPAGCFEQVQQRKLVVMFHGPYRSGFGGGELKVDHEWVRGFMTRRATYWRGTDQLQTETRWDPTGQTREERNWSAEGQLLSVIPWKDQVRHGTEIQWRSDGSLLRETQWRDGKKNGVETTWHENGARHHQRMFKDDLLHGMARSWHANGTLAQQGNYVRNHARGLHTTWWDNGQKRTEGHYSEDSQIAMQLGLWLQWDRDGRCIDATEYIWDSDRNTRYTRRAQCP